MSGTPAGTSLAPRIGAQGIESLTNEASRYQNNGFAIARLTDVSDVDIWFITQYGSFKIAQDKSKTDLCIVREWLEARDWYLAHAQATHLPRHEREGSMRIVGDLYVPKPDVIPVTNIQIP